jgi:cytochrome c peroxidase
MRFPVFPDATIESKYGFTKDLGRFDVTKNESDKFTYRVPSLRNVAMTAPYFHNGSVNDLKEAIRIMAKLQLNRTIDEADVNSISVFLGSLSDKLPVISAPRLPPTSGTAIFE